MPNYSEIQEEDAIVQDQQNTKRPAVFVIPKGKEEERSSPYGTLTPLMKQWKHMYFHKSSTDICIFEENMDS